MVSMLFIKELFCHWHSWNVGSEKGLADFSDALRPGRPTAAVTHLLLHHADEFIQNDWHITTQKLASELSASKEHVNNITDALGYTKVCNNWVSGSLTDNHKTVRQGWVHICSPIMRLMVKALIQDHQLEWNINPTVWTTDKKDSQWHDIIQLLLRRWSVRLPLQQVEIWPLFYRVILADIMWFGQTINKDLYIPTLKPSGRHSGELDFTKLLLKFSSKMTTHSHVQVWKHSMK